MTTLASMALHSPPVTLLNECDNDSSLMLNQHRLLLNGDLDEEIRRLEREGDCLRNSRPDSVMWSKQLMPEKKPIDILSDRASTLGFRLTDGVTLTGKDLTLASKEETLSHPEFPFSSYALHISSTGNILEKEAPSVSSLPLNSLSGIFLPRPSIAKFQSSYSSEDDAMSLQMKLHDSNLIAEKQREHFHFSLEDLRRKYEADVSTKELALRSKEMETAAHKSIVIKLKQQNEHLQEDNRKHEKTIKDLRDLLETHQREQRFVEMGLGQVRSQVLSQEQKRGCRFYEDTPLLQQGINSLLKSIEKCIQELDTDVESKNDQIRELVEKLERNKEFLLEKEKELKLEFDSKCSELMKKQKEALDLEAKEIASLKKQLAVQEEEASRQKSQLEHEIKLKDASLSDLDARLKLAKEDLTTERSSWLIKNQNFDAVVESDRQELGTLKKESVIRTQELSEMKTNQAELQMSHLKAKTDLDSALRLSDLLRERETGLMLRQNVLEEELRKKTHLLSDLDKKLETANQENETHLRRLSELTEKDKNKSSAEQVQSLQIQLNALTEKCRQLTLDLELSAANQQTLQEKYSQLQFSHETLRLRAESATREKEKLNADISECMAEVTRLTLERAAHLESLESSSLQLSSLRCQKDRLVVQLEEREKNFLAVREENDKLVVLMDSYNTANAVAQKEHNHLGLRLIEANAQLKTTKRRMASLKQNRNEEVRSEDDGCEADAVGSSLKRELVEAEQEILSLKEQVDVLQRSLKLRDGSSEKELSKLLQRLQLTEHNLRVARKALRKHDEIDGRAFEIASRMQKEVTAKRSEVDILKTKIRQLQDSLDVADQEKRKLEETNQALNASIRRTAKQRDQLAEELRLGQLKHRQQLPPEESSELKDAEIAKVEKSKMTLRKDTKGLNLLAEIGQSPHTIINGANLLGAVELEDTSPGIKHPMSMKSIAQWNHRAHASSVPVVRLLDDLSEFSPDDGSVPSNGYNCDSTSVTAQSGSSKQDSTVVNRVQNCYRKANQNWPEEDAPTKDYSSVRPSSSVFDLLTGNPSSAHSTHRESGRHRHSRRSKRTAFDSDTKAICHRLEKRIEALTKIGGNLHEENQKSAKAMKDHGKRLMKLKKEFKK